VFINNIVKNNFLYTIFLLKIILNIKTAIEKQNANNPNKMLLIKTNTDVRIINNNSPTFKYVILFSEYIGINNIITRFLLN